MSPTKIYNLELSLKDFSLQLSSSDENRVVADVCIYPQDQLYRDQLQRDELFQDQLQRHQLQQQEEFQGDQVQRHRGENQHEVSIYPDPIYPDINYPDLTFSRMAATEVCLPVLRHLLLICKRTPLKNITQIKCYFETINCIKSFLSIEHNSTQATATAGSESFLFSSSDARCKISSKDQCITSLRFHQMLNVRFHEKYSM